MRLTRKLWTQENVAFAGDHFSVDGSTVVPRIEVRGERRHPKLYFGGASEAAERVAATEADVQLFWGEPLDGVRERIERLKALSRDLDRDLPPLEFGLRITTFIRDTTERAWTEAEAKVAEMAKGKGAGWNDHQRATAVGQQRLLDLHAQGEVLDDNLYTTPGKFGGGGAGATAGGLGRGCRPFVTQIPRSRHQPFRPVRHALPAGNQAAGRPATALAAQLRWCGRRLSGAARWCVRSRWRGPVPA